MGTPATVITATFTNTVATTLAVHHIRLHDAARRMDQRWREPLPVQSKLWEHHHFQHRPLVGSWRLRPLLLYRNEQPTHRR